MGLKFKVDGEEQPTEKIVTTSEGINNVEKERNFFEREWVDKPGNQKLYERDNEPIPMSKEMTNRLWEIINENTELKQQLYLAEHRLEQIRRLLEE